MYVSRAAWLLATLFIIVPVAARSQERPAPAVDLSIGYAGFVDEATIDHFMIGGGMRWHVTPRVSLGPEVVYMIGPREDRDLFFTGNVTFDILDFTAVTPYLVAGGGLMLHRDVFRTGPFWSNEGTFTAGGGVRARLTDRLYVAPELRIGWEPHWRVSATFGWRLGP